MSWLNSNITLEVAERVIADLERTTPQERRVVIGWARRRALSKPGRERRPYEHILRTIHNALPTLRDDFQPTTSQQERFGP